MLLAIVVAQFEPEEYLLNEGETKMNIWEHKSVGVGTGPKEPCPGKREDCHLHKESWDFKNRWTPRFKFALSALVVVFLATYTFWPFISKAFR
jgi:hypothetical protein